MVAETGVAISVRQSGLNRKAKFALASIAVIAITVLSRLSTHSMTADDTSGSAVQFTVIQTVADKGFQRLDRVKVNETGTFDSAPHGTNESGTSTPLVIVAPIADRKYELATLRNQSNFNADELLQKLITPQNIREQII